MEALLILIFICSHLIASDASIAVDLHCPEQFHDGENIVNCTINSTAVREADCLSVSESVTFDRTIGSQTTAVCTCKYDPNQQCNHPTQNTGSCWCSKSEKDIFTYSFSYLANSKLDQGGQLECKICIFPEKTFNLNVHRSCRSMSFEKNELTTVVSKEPNTSVGEGDSTEAAGKDPNSGDHSNNSGETGGIVGGIIGAILLIAILIVAVIYCKKRKKSHCSSSKKDTSFETNPEDEERNRKMLTKEEKNDDGSVLKETDDSPKRLRGFEPKDEEERGETLLIRGEMNVGKKQQNGIPQVPIT